MKPTAFLLLGLAMILAAIALTSCEPGTPVTVSGYYKGADGSKSGLSGTFVPRAKIHADK
jgi:hypothetical protein